MICIKIGNWFIRLYIIIHEEQVNIPAAELPVFYIYLGTYEQSKIWLLQPIESHLY